MPTFGSPFPPFLSPPWQAGQPPIAFAVADGDTPVVVDARAGTVTGTSTSTATAVGAKTGLGTALATTGSTATSSGRKTGSGTATNATLSTAIATAPSAPPTPGATSTTGTATGRSGRQGSALGVTTTSSTTSGKAGRSGTTAGGTSTAGSAAGTAARSGGAVAVTTSTGVVACHCARVGYVTGMTTNSATAVGQTPLDPTPPLSGGGGSGPSWAAPTPAKKRKQQFHGTCSGITRTHGQAHGNAAHSSTAEPDDLNSRGAITGRAGRCGMTGRNSLTVLHRLDGQAARGGVTAGRVADNTVVVTAVRRHPVQDEEETLLVLLL